jgi:hypothetical protein
MKSRGEASSGIKTAAYSEYDAISDWRFCPDDADPLEYLQAQSNP